MCPIVIHFGGSEALVGPRALGAFTGSKSAAALGRVPVEFAYMAARSDFGHLGFRIHDQAFYGATFVDNLFTLGSSADKAVALMEVVLAFLAKWSLWPKATSLAVISNHDCDKNVGRFPWSRSMLALGHTLSAHNEFHGEWARIRASLSAVVYANQKKRSFRRLCVGARLRSFKRMCDPRLRFFLTRIPFTEPVAQKLDQFQRRLIGVVVPTARMANETDLVYFARRSKLAASHQRKMGCWSRLWASLVKSWTQHLERHADTWCGTVHTWADTTWLSLRRAMFAGQLRSRLWAGRPQARWSDGIVIAKTF